MKTHSRMTVEKEDTRPNSSAWCVLHLNRGEVRGVWGEVRGVNQQVADTQHAYRTAGQILVVRVNITRLNRNKGCSPRPSHSWSIIGKDLHFFL